MKNIGLFYLTKLCAFFVGLSSCFYLHQEMSLPIVLSAALTGLVGSFFPYTSRYHYHPQAAIYTGAFAGMCSSNVIQSSIELVAISVIGALIYTLLRNVFVGIGGKLGAIAFTAVASVVLVKGMMG